MPTLRVTTNVPVDAATASDTMKLLSKAVNELTGKPEAYIMVLIQGSTPMQFAQSEEPTAFMELFSIGAIGGEKNSKIAARLMAIVGEKIGVPANRTYLSFHDSARSDFAFNGATF